MEEGGCNTSDINTNEELHPLGELSISIRTYYLFVTDENSPVIQPNYDYHFSVPVFPDRYLGELRTMCQNRTRLTRNTGKIIAVKA